MGHLDFVFSWAALAFGIAQQQMFVQVTIMHFANSPFVLFCGCECDDHAMAVCFVLGLLLAYPYPYPYR